MGAAAAAKLLQSCPTVRPHTRQLTGLLCPWDSPEKNIGVACHVRLQCMHALCDPMDSSPPGFSVHGIL